MALTNNDVIKKLRVALQLRDDDIIEVLGLVDYKIGKTELSAFFRKEDHPKYVLMGDQILRNFLNGLVIYKRGPMEPKAGGAGKNSRTLPKSKPSGEKKSGAGGKSKTREVRFGGKGR